MKRTIILAVVVVIGVAAFYLYQLTQEKTPDVVNQRPDVVITASELIAAFDRDSASARKNYIDKIVEVTGNVKRIDTTGSVVLGEDGSASEVTIGLDRRHLKDHEKLKVGSVAVLQGVCTGSRNDNSGSDSTDLFSGLGTTVELRAAGVKNKQ